MAWKQFLSPVAALDAGAAKRYIAEHTPEAVAILDVRQPKEYKRGHIPGARLMPLPGLADSYRELDPEKPTIVYCAVGGRSRIAAQMLNGKGFSEVYNLTGGIKAWNADVAVGSTEQGLQYFTGKEEAGEILTVAFGLETGLRDFYLEQAAKISSPTAAALFSKMAVIELRHQEKIVKEYNRLTGKDLSVPEFAKNIVVSAMEGGLSTAEYAAMIARPPESPQEVIEIAMSIEAQALDLYMRAADNSQDATSQAILLKIAGEERAHLTRLGELLEDIL